MKYATVIPKTRLPRNISPLFSYLIPEALEKSVQEGQLVLVPFRNKDVEAIVVAVHSDVAPQLRYKLKPVSKILDAVALTEEQVRLAWWLTHQTASSFATVLKMLVPARLKRAQKEVAKSETTPKKTLRKIKFDDWRGQSVEQIEKALAAKSFTQLFWQAPRVRGQLYPQLVDSAARLKKQTLILVPDLVRGRELARDAVSRLGQHRVLFIHHNIATGARLRMWKQIQDGSVDVVIGVRSSIFAPFNNPGLIIVDDEHDDSHKQYDQNPRYDTREAAAFYAKLWKAVLLVTSETPRVVTYYAVTQKKFTTLPVPKDKKPPVELIDMRAEKRGGNWSVISNDLQEAIEASLAAKNKVLLFVQRRGSASVVLCGDCGFTAKCPHCDVPLSYHAKSGILLCHYCGYQEPVFITCPNCHGHNVKHVGAGTERIELEMQKLYPNAKTIRVDRDALLKDNSLKTVRGEVERGAYDIVVGTSSLIKNFSIKGLGVIGIIAADTLLHLPEYTAAERTYQLITEVIGLGRENKHARILCQTFHQEHYAVRAAVTGSYQDLYDKEIVERKSFDYPPFAELVKIMCVSKEKARAQTLADEVKTKIKRAKLVSEDEIIGPSPAFVSKIQDVYRFNILLKLSPTATWDKVSKFLTTLPPECIVDVHPVSIL